MASGVMCFSWRTALVEVIHSHEGRDKVLSSMEEDGLIDRTDNRIGGREIGYSLTPLGIIISEV